MFRGNPHRKWQTTLPSLTATLVVALLTSLGVWANSQSAPAADVSVEVSQASLALTARVEPVGPPKPLPRPAPRSRGELEARMFTGRFNGPYAASVRTVMTETLIEDRLFERGVRVASEGSPKRGAMLAAIPSHLPALGYVSSNFGERRSPFTGKMVRHNGIDIAVDHGDPVFTTADGIVTYSGWRRAHGKIVVVDHGFGIVTKYAHNSRLMVKAGDTVQRGDVIAKAGSTGRSTGTHVHYELWVKGRAVDPTTLMFDVPQRAPYGDSSIELMAGMGLGRHHGNGAAMGGEVDLSDAPELGPSVAGRLSQPDRGLLAAKSGAVLSVFFALALAVVACVRPRSEFN